MSGHTPGPWRVSTHGLMIDNRRTNIAECLRMEMADGEAEANARLIAAAPDLLAWAEKSSHDLNCSSFRANFMGVVRRDGPCNCGRDAAIAKARGGA